MPITELPYLHVGQIVTYGSTGTTLYKVTRVKIAKFIATESVTGRKIEGRIEYARPCPGRAGEFIETVEDLEPAPALGLGTAVRFKDPGVKNRGVYVCINQTAGGWRVARLGGKDGMRYTYNVDAKRLVPVSEINNVEWV